MGIIGVRGHKLYKFYVKRLQNDPLHCKKKWNFRSIKTFLMNKMSLKIMCCFQKKDENDLYQTFEGEWKIVVKCWNC